MPASIAQFFPCPPEGETLAEMLRDRRRKKDVLALRNDLLIAFPGKGDHNSWLETMARVMKLGFFRVFSKHLEKAERKIGLEAYHRELRSAKFFAGYTHSLTYFDPRDPRPDATRVRITSHWRVQEDPEDLRFDHEVEVLSGFEHSDDHSTTAVLTERGFPSPELPASRVLSILDEYLSKSTLDLTADTLSRRWAAGLLRRANFNVEPRTSFDDQDDAWVRRSDDGRVYVELRGTGSWPRTTLIGLDDPVTLKGFWLDEDGKEIGFRHGFFSLKEAIAKTAEIMPC